MALVTLIKGVCREGDTFQTTKYPAKTAMMKIPKLIMKAASVTNPRPIAKAKVITRVTNAFPKFVLL